MQRRTTMTTRTMTTRAGGQRSDGGRDIELGVGRVMDVEEEEARPRDVASMRPVKRDVDLLTNQRSYAIA